MKLQATTVSTLTINGTTYTGTTTTTETGGAVNINCQLDQTYTPVDAGM